MYMGFDIGPIFREVLLWPVDLCWDVPKNIWISLSLPPSVHLESPLHASAKHCSGLLQDQKLGLASALGAMCL